MLRLVLHFASPSAYELSLPERGEGVEGRVGGWVRGKESDILCARVCVRARCVCKRERDERESLREMRECLCERYGVVRECERERNGEAHAFSPSV